MMKRRPRQLKGKIESMERIIEEVRQTVQAMRVVATTRANVIAIERFEVLEAQAVRLETLAKSVRGDYESVRVEAALQREVTLRLFAQSPAGAPLGTLRSLEEEIRRQVISEEKHDAPAT